MSAPADVTKLLGSLGVATDGPIVQLPPAPLVSSDPSDPLCCHLDVDVPTKLAEYDKFWEKEDPEENPYKSKYEARATLESVFKKTDELLAKHADSAQAERARELLARVMLYLGKNYYFCEEVPTAERHFNRALERYLRSPLRASPCYFIHIQDVLNQLGMLWCNRQGYTEGMNFLRRAQIMFMNRPAEVRKDMETQAENNYTLTMFYLAQAYGGLQKGALSARFCAATMSRQLEHNASGSRTKEVIEKDPFDCKDWVRNCCSLSDFFTNHGMCWTAEYLLHSAAAMCDGCKDICGFEPENIEELRAEVSRDLAIMYSSRLKFAKTCAENPYFGERIWKGERKRVVRQSDEEREGSRLTFGCSADLGMERPGPTVGEGPMVWDEIFPEVVYLEDEEEEDKRMAEEAVIVGVFDPPDRAAPPDQASLGLHLRAGERVVLPVHFAQLHGHVEKRLRSANRAFLELRGEPALVQKPPKPVLPERQEGEEEQEPAPAEEEDENGPESVRVPSSVALAFQPVREIFKMANHYFTQALSYFLLDGWVTDHVRLLQELSQLYRTIQFWERDPKRSAAMSMRRTRMLAPLMEQLNPRVYIAFWRQLSFECAEVYQELYELKANGKLPGRELAAPFNEEGDDRPGAAPARLARCNELADKSIASYDVFVDSYHQDGKIPDRIEDDSVRVYLTARLNRARLATKMRGLSRDDQLERHKSALLEYEFIQDYGQRNPEVYDKPEIGMATEMKLCHEMASMLPSKLSQIAARR